MSDVAGGNQGAGRTLKSKALEILLRFVCSSEIDLSTLIQNRDFVEQLNQMSLAPDDKLQKVLTS